MVELFLTSDLNLGLMFCFDCSTTGYMLLALVSSPSMDFWREAPFLLMRCLGKPGKRFSKTDLLRP